MAPAARCHIEAILRDQLPAMISDHRDGLDYVLEDVLTDEVIEVHSHPAGLNSLATVADFAFELMASLKVNSKESVSVRSCT